ncbi:Fur family transcriptional regulator [Planctomycetota bacterium]|nr:Fur family transcriptional regulator [Planctomycetota bacterium]
MGKVTKKPANVDLDDMLNTFEAFLRKKGLKLTSQRAQILDKILEMDKVHFTADDLLEQFFDQRPRVSKATIYRALGVMVEAELLEEHQFGDQHRVYELSEGRDHHDHLICTECGTIIEFFSEEMEELQEKIAKKKGFKPTHHSQKIYGLCKSCR